MVFSSTPTTAQAVALPRTRVIGLMAVFAVAALAVTYLVLVNAVASRGVELRSLRSNLDQLRLAHQELESKVSELQSYTVTEEQVSTTTFVAVDRVEYLAALAPTVGVAVK